MNNEPEIQSASELLGTKITVNGQEIIFSELSIYEAISDASSFSFNWRQAENKFNISDHHDFYGKNLGGEVVITIGTKFNFKGFIFSINCFNQEDYAIEYQIEGKGTAGVLSMGLSCKTFHKKKLSEIVKEVLSGTGIAIKLNIENDLEAYYTVQYNQSIWDFLCMLAARNGLWFYYTGVELYMGKQQATPTKLTNGSNLFNWQFTGKVIADTLNSASFDIFKGVGIKGKGQLISQKGFFEASVKGGNKINKVEPKQHSTQEVVEKNLKSGLSFNMESVLSNSVHVTGNSYALEVRTGVTVTINNFSGISQGDYIVTKVEHNCQETYHYTNSFTAIPATAKVPPNTKALLHPLAMAQPAKVVDNEDKDGLDRIKVRFPWQAEKEQSPWVPVLVPHAGRNKGFRFLPELGDSVMVGFMDDNAERPYIMGAFFNNEQKSGLKHEENKQKFIGTVSGRRLTWDEDKEILALNDNTFDFPANKLTMSREKGQESLKIESGTNKSNGSIIEMKNEKNLEIGMLSGGALVAKIIFDSKSKKITIESDDLVEIKSQKKITMEAPEIEIKAQKKLTLESTAEVGMKGANVKIAADVQLEAKGTNATFEGSAMAEFKGGAMAVLKGGVVMIN